MPIKCFLPVHGTKPTKELLPGSSWGGGRRWGGGDLLRSVNTASLSHRRGVLLAGRAGAWGVTDGYLVGRSHLELRIMAFVCPLEFFSFSWLASVNFLNLYLPVILFIRISGVFSQRLQIPKDHGLWSMTHHTRLLPVQPRFQILMDYYNYCHYY